ncbi:MAG: hypothetical protein KAG61_07410 [Bacteriovoracaceae bacterium]|nr:hypothetical protein [Bacteriovoracaceae bacterium]
MIQCKNICSIVERKTLLEFLREDLLLSRSKIKKYFNSKQLSLPVSKGSEYAVPLALLNMGMVNPIYCGPSIEVLFEDQNILALLKPHSVHCHPHGYLESDNTLSFLRSIGHTQVLSTNTKGMDRGLLFRLDSGTSGVLLFAKNDATYNEIRSGFGSVAKLKTYQAIVCGKACESGRIDSFLVGTGRKGSQMRSCDSTDLGAQLANLSYKTIRYDKEQDLSLVQIELETGVRHQIRAQFSILGLPLLGDTIYGGTVSDRIYLHALEYKLESESISVSINARWNPLI